MLNARLRATPLLALLSLGMGLGCSLILDPANSDDVVRCTNSTDCEADDGFSSILNSDYRLAAQCANTGAGGGGDIGQSSGQQVCAAIYDQEIGCNGGNFDMGTNLGMAYAAADEADLYRSCEGQYVGTLGCRPCLVTEIDDGNMDSPQCAALDSAGCVDGLQEVERNGTKVCVDDPDAAIFPANVADPTNDAENLAFQDLFDQHCRSYFCNDTFVCDRTTFKCVPCDPDSDFGYGGCGEMYIGGALSSHYQTQDALDDACDLGKSRDGAGADTNFGPTPAL